MCVAVETEAGRPGRHGDSAAPAAARDSSCASAPATTRRRGTEVASAWGRAAMRGEGGGDSSVVDLETLGAPV